MDDNSLINFRLLPGEQNLQMKGNSFNPFLRNAVI